MFKIYMHPNFVLCKLFDILVFSLQFWRAWPLTLKTFHLLKHKTQCSTKQGTPSWVAADVISFIFLSVDPIIICLWAFTKRFRVSSCSLTLTLSQWFCADLILAAVAGVPMPKGDADPTVLSLSIPRQHPALQARTIRTWGETRAKQHWAKA